MHLRPDLGLRRVQEKEEVEAEPNRDVDATRLAPLPLNGKVRRQRRRHSAETLVATTDEDEEDDEEKEEEELSEWDSQTAL